MILWICDLIIKLQRKGINMLKKIVKSFLKCGFIINSSKIFLVQCLFIFTILFTIFFNIFEFYMFGSRVFPYWVFRVIGLLCNVILLTVLLIIIISYAKKCELKKKELEDKINTYDNQVKEEQNLKRVLSERSEAKFHAIFDAASDGLCVFDPNGMLVDANKAAHKLLGFSKEEIMKLQITQIESPEYASTSKDRINKVLADGYAEYTVDLIKKDGGIVTVEVKASVIDLGKDKYILKASRDITERKILENEKQKELVYLHSLISLLKNYTTDEDLLVEAGLEEIRKITDSKYACIYEYDDNNKVFIKSYWTKNANSIFECHNYKDIHLTGVWGDIISTGQSILIENFSDETEGFCFDAKLKIRKFFAVPLFHKGVIAAIVGVANKDLEYTSEDEKQLTIFMTSLGNKIELLRKTNDLVKISKELKETNANLEDFTYIASHDLKEPLRSLSNYSSFLLEDYSDKLDDEGKHMLNVLIKQSKRMEELINALLQYSKISKSIPERSTIDLSIVINEVVDDLNYLIKSSNVSIKIDRKLPILKGNRLFIKEIYLNLVSNAIKYNNKNEKIVTIGYLDSSDESQITLFVKDNGIGIPEKHFENVFKIFKRLHSRDDYGGGTGAGLTIVKKMIEIHKGAIWIESIVNEGTTFYFTLEA